MNSDLEGPPGARLANVLWPGEEAGHVTSMLVGR